MIRHIPRLLRGALLENCLKFYAGEIGAVDNLRLLQNSLKVGKIDPETKLKIRTQDQFGFEWKKWPRLPSFAENHFFHVLGTSQEFLLGKVGWDPAVGMGRDLFNACQSVGEKGFMVGSDLSFAVDQTYERCKEFDNVLIIQADLFDSFLEHSSFDFIYMIGLIQHLTNPALGVRHVCQRLKPGGSFIGTIYERPTDFLVGLVIGTVCLVRPLTTKIPFEFLYLLAKCFALPAYLFFSLPDFLLRRFKYVQNMRTIYPGHGTTEGRPDLELLTHAWFDHFSPPIARFFKKAEGRALFATPELEVHFFENGFVRGTRPLT